MTNIIRRNMFAPTMFPTSLFDDAFRDIDDVFGRYKDNVPYNVVQNRDKDGNITSTSVEVALAGYSKENIKVQVDEDELHIMVENNQKEVEDQNGYVHRGISRRSIQLKFKLSGTSDVNKIKSEFKDGLLKVNVPVSKKNVIDINID